MLSQHYKNWLSIEDGHRCVPCKNMHGKIYEVNEIPNPEPPLHENCRCIITPMKAMTAGTATNNKSLGADWWLYQFRCLPPYYISEDEARNLGWRSKKKNLAVVAPGRMITKGEYQDRDGHLPTENGRIWYEADINYTSGKRNTERIVYSSDGLIFVTYDHYLTFTEITDPSF